MDIATAQRDVRTAFLGGFAGQLVSGLIWLASGASATWSSPKLAILLLVVGGIFIFPLTLLLLKAMGRPAGLPKNHPMNGLGLQVALIVPFTLPVVGGATLHHLNWFYPACMIVVGAHYLPFIFMYGMWQFGVLAALLIGGGLALGMFVPSSFVLGAWVTAIALMVFAFIARAASAREHEIGRETAA